MPTALSLTIAFDDDALLRQINVVLVDAFNSFKGVYYIFDTGLAGHFDRELGLGNVGGMAIPKVSDSVLTHSAFKKSSVPTVGPKECFRIP